MAVAYEHGPIDAPIAACPGWDVRQLVEHMAHIHRWADFAVRNARRPDDSELDTPGDDVDLADWLRVGAATLAEGLAAADPQAETWHVFAVERKIWVWARRQAMETAVHRWDAEAAIAGRAELDAELAGQGVLEYFELAVPRILKRQGVLAPTVRLGVHCHDLGGGVGGDVTVWTDGDGYHWTTEHRDVDATLSGPSASLLLLLMGRADRSQVTITGDTGAADAWLSLPGW